jgi:6-methylsalicylate decarboxylase
MFLDMPWEPGGDIDLARHDPQRRLIDLDRQEIDTAVISISTPVGCEALPADEAAPLVEAYNTGIAEIVNGSGGRLQALAAVVLDDVDAALPDVEALLDDGFAGVAVPSEALAGPEALEQVQPLLELVAGRARPLLVHPGPAPWTSPQPASGALPGWWTALGQYPAWSQRAFFTWRAIGREQHPTLRTVWAILAGGAPLLEHRWRVFSGEPGAIDPNLFFDTASSGREALELTLSTYGAEQVVYGSDHPVIDAYPTHRAVTALGSGVADLILEQNPARLLAPTEAPHE